MRIGTITTLPRSWSISHKGRCLKIHGHHRRRRLCFKISIGDTKICSIDHVCAGEHAGNLSTTNLFACNIAWSMNTKNTVEHFSHVSLMTGKPENEDALSRILIINQTIPCTPQHRDLQVSPAYASTDPSKYHLDVKHQTDISRWLPSSQYHVSCFSPCITLNLLYLHATREAYVNWGGKSKRSPLISVDDREFTYCIGLLWGQVWLMKDAKGSDRLLEGGAGWSLGAVFFYLCFGRWRCMWFCNRQNLVSR